MVLAACLRAVGQRDRADTEQLQPPRLDRVGRIVLTVGSGIGFVGAVIETLGVLFDW